MSKLPFKRTNFKVLTHSAILNSLKQTSYVLICVFSILSAPFQFFKMFFSFFQPLSSFVFNLCFFSFFQLLSKAPSRTSSRRRKLSGDFWPGTNLIKLFTTVKGLHHPLDGVTNPKYKLLCFIQLTFFAKRRGHKLLNRIGAAI